MIRLKNVILFIICCCQMTTQAQVSADDYRSLVQEGKYWGVKEQYAVDLQLVEKGQYSYVIHGDTLISNLNWKKVYYRQGNGQPAYYAAIREKERKVYIIMDGNNRQRLLYDFGMQVGETVRCGWLSDSICCILESDETADNFYGCPLDAFMKLEGVDTVKAFGKDSRRFVFSVHWPAKEFPDSYVVWIEGVGSDGSLFSPWTIIPAQKSLFYIECKDGAGNTFDNTDFYVASDVPEINTILSSPYTIDRVPVPPYYIDQNDRYLYYAGSDENGKPVYELVYTWRNTEEIDGKLYYTIYDYLSANGQKQLNFIRMREDKGCIYVRLDDYKRFMHSTRGRDVSVFEKQCQYELTDDGELVLYNFNMQVGDKFRSVEGKEDVYVTRIEKTTSRADTDEIFDIFYLSNGACLVSKIGFTGHIDVPNKGTSTSGDFFDYLNCCTYNVKLQTVQKGSDCLYGNGGGWLMGVGSVDGSAMCNGVPKTFSISGKETGKPYAPGIYIRNGRKFVVK